MHVCTHACSLMFACMPIHTHTGVLTIRYHSQNRPLCFQTSNPTWTLSMTYITLHQRVIHLFGVHAIYQAMYLKVIILSFLSKDAEHNF